jgi:hypothetical protein
VRTLDVWKKIAFLVPPAGTRRNEAYRSVFAIAGAGASAVVVAGNLHDSTWQQLRADPEEFKPRTEAGWPVWTAIKPDSHVHFIPALELWRGRFRQLIGRAAIDTAQLRSPDPTPRSIRLGVPATVHSPRQIQRVSHVPNVVGVVRGTDARLREQFLVVTAHFDGLGTKSGFPPGPMGTLNGADDNASGVAAMLEMARAIAKAPLKRSVLLVAVSGEERGLWGSDHFASKPPVPLSSIIANINLDMIGRSNADSVFVLTSQDTAITARIASVLRNPAMSRVVALDQNALARRYPNEPIANRSDHANFHRRGIPFVYLFTGWHADYHESTDDAPSLNYEGLARITKFAYELAVSLANR